ncbi:hypothetical protein [uncultured Arcticibacterium sp.]|uniref:hypothetical protein n=1 Tax=uncultured Arcticibacterium sp. TaxID=2173042 RepID=UPI0030F59C8C
MNIFPINKRKFILNQAQEETLYLLNKETEKSENLTSNYTEKSFLGIIEGNQFKLISSDMVKGSFCVMTGEVNLKSGYVKVEINGVFRILLAIVFCFPLIGILILLTQSVPLQVVLIALITLFVRYVLIGLTFKFLSEESLERLKEVLDIEWTK